MKKFSKKEWIFIEYAIEVAISQCESENSVNSLKLKDIGIGLRNKIKKCKRKDNI